MARSQGVRVHAAFGVRMEEAGLLAVEDGLQTRRVGETEDAPTKGRLHL